METAPCLRRPLYSKIGTFSNPFAVLLLAVLIGCSFLCFMNVRLRHHERNNRIIRGQSATPASFADYSGPRCLITPYPVCDGRTTVGGLGPEQGCTVLSGPPAAGKFFTPSFHTGTSNEMAWIGEELGIDMNIGGFCSKMNASPENEDNPYVFSRERINSIWRDPALAERLESYAGVITTDTSMAMYPFLSNPKFNTKPLIIWITNRYDTTMSDRFSSRSMTDYLEAMEKAACCKKNVFFVAAHPAEIEYAKIKHPSMDTARWRIIYPTGHESKWLRKQLKKEHGTTWTDNLQHLHSEPKPEKLCLYPGLNEAIMMEDFGSALSSHDIDFDNDLGAPREARRYGGPRGLKMRCKGIIHVPYAPQTMALWENAQVENVLFLPTPRLLVQWAASPNFKKLKGVFQMSNHINLDRPLQEDFLNRTEWYREDRRPLFVYFDSADDLVHQFKTLDFEIKRKQIRAYMLKHTQGQLDKWKELLEEIRLQMPSFQIPLLNANHSSSRVGTEDIRMNKEASKVHRIEHQKHSSSTAAVTIDDSAITEDASSKASSERTAAMSAEGGVIMAAKNQRHRHQAKRKTDTLLKFAKRARAAKLAKEVKTLAQGARRAVLTKAAKRGDELTKAANRANEQTID